MKTITYVCDRCDLPIDGKTTPVKDSRGACDAELVVIERRYSGSGHNGIPSTGWHFHYSCFTAVANFVNTKES